MDNLNVLFLTPLPGTRLWDQMKAQGRIPLASLPQDWKYYTLTYPVARYEHLSLDGIIEEMVCCNETFYSGPHIFRRLLSSVWHRRKPWISLAGNLSYRRNIRLAAVTYVNFKCHCGDRHENVKES